jgi:hypothetical protein
MNKKSTRQKGKKVPVSQKVPRKEGYNIKKTFSKTGTFLPFCLVDI